MKSWIFCVFLYPFTIISAKKGDKPKLVDPSTGSMTLEVGATARLKCDFLSWKPEWKMVWKVNGKVVQIRKNKRFRQRNGRSSLLRIKEIVKADSGMYECIASNDYGSVSKLLNLTVVGELKPLGEHGKGPPWFTKTAQPRNVAWPASGDMKLRCPADGEPPLKYLWLKDGKGLKYRRLDPKFNSTRWYLRIKTAVPSDNGIYKCVVYNRLGNISHEFQLTVIEKGPVRPVLSAQFPVNKTARIGDNVTFQCIELFSPILTDYKWLHWNRLPPNYPDFGFGDDPPSFNSSYYTVISPLHYKPFRVQKAEGKYGGSVLLTNVTKEDEGMYTCLISNHVGKSWKSAFLRVLNEEKGPVRPVLSAQFPVNKTARIGDNVTFQCIELFSPILTDYKWLHWNRLPPNYPDFGFGDDPPSFNSTYYKVISVRHYQSFPVQKAEGKYGGSVLLTNVTKEDEGMYTCLISNHVGKSWKSAFLRVLNEEKPTRFIQSTIQSIENFETDLLTNTAKLVIIITCGWITMALFGFSLICYWVRQRHKRGKKAGNKQDPLSYVTLALIPSRLYDNGHRVNDDWNIDRDHLMKDLKDEAATGDLLKTQKLATNV